MVSYGDTDERIACFQAYERRDKLAETIRHRLTTGRGENIAVVGAHRIGKSTVLNLVEDLLLRNDGDEARKVLPLRINAAVTPPAEFISAVLDRPHHLSERTQGRLSRFRQGCASPYMRSFMLPRR